MYAAQSMSIIMLKYPVVLNQPVSCFLQFTILIGEGDNVIVP